MQAAVGDRLVVHSQHVDDPVRDGEIIEVHGQDGGPPFVVRWSDTGRTSLYVPSSDAEVQHQA
ncbi:MAG: DUF1918 domain-containing protein [Nocardioidaceae bacterium]